MDRTITHQPKEQIYKPDPFEQGRLFEEYVKNLFNQQNFRLKKWNKSRRLDEDTFIGGLSNPDLELVFVRNYSYLLQWNANGSRNFIMEKSNGQKKNRYYDMRIFKRKEPCLYL